MGKFSAGAIGWNLILAVSWWRVYIGRKNEDKVRNNIKEFNHVNRLLLEATRFAGQAVS